MSGRDRAMVPAATPGFQYGAGLFETIRVEEGTPLFFQAHVRRMETSWKTLFNSKPPDITWSWVVDRLLRENRLKSSTAAVKLILYLAQDHGSEGFRALPAAFARPYAHRLSILGKKGLDLITYPHPRLTPLADHKTMNYLYYEQARKHALAQGGDEALILNPDATVSETNTCNILIKDGKDILLPSSDHVLPGVVSALLAKMLEARGYTIRKEPLDARDFKGFGNIILTNSLMGAVKVLGVDGHGIVHEPGFCQDLNKMLGIKMT